MNKKHYFDKLRILRKMQKAAFFESFDLDQLLSHVHQKTMTELRPSVIKRKGDFERP